MQRNTAGLLTTGDKLPEMIWLSDIADQRWIMEFCSFTKFNPCILYPLWVLSLGSSFHCVKTSPFFDLSDLGILLISLPKIKNPILYQWMLVLPSWLEFRLCDLKSLRKYTIPDSMCVINGDLIFRSGKIRVKVWSKAANGSYHKKNTVIVAVMMIFIVICLSDAEIK